MPPATMTSALPVARMSCASIAAFMPEPHILLTVVQPVPSGSPAPSEAWRAGAWPCPAGSTQPMITSLTSSAPIFARHPGRLFRRVQDGAGGVLAGGLAAVERLADGVDVGAAGGKRGVHVGELALHQLEFADRLAELLALVHVRHDHIEARGHDAE